MLARYFAANFCFWYAFGVFSVGKFNYSVLIKGCICIFVFSLSFKCEFYFPIGIFEAGVQFCYFGGNF